MSSELRRRIERVSRLDDVRALREQVAAQRPDADESHALVLSTRQTVVELEQKVMEHVAMALEAMQKMRDD